MQALRLKLARAFKAYGPALPAVLLRRITGRFVTLETLVVYSQSMQEPAVSSRKPLPAITVSRIDDAGSRMFRDLCVHYPGQDFASRLQQEQHECYVALCGDSICAYAWVATTALFIEEVALLFPVAANEIFIFDCHVDARMRGGGIFPLLLAAVLKDQGARRTGLQRACIAACTSNRASRRGICKAGFVPLKRIHLFACRSLCLHWESSRVAAPHGRSGNGNVDAELASVPDSAIQARR